MDIIMTKHAFVSENFSKIEVRGYGLWCLMPLLTLFQLYRFSKLVKK